ncbi:hypothetical protein P7D98_22510 [Enterococcus avium]|uniref:Transposase n=1 Tax=Enterococcus avium TaxID=33945 RepID=A0ABD5FGW8_ENTAV|nr:hypothetical protein [Enterococcus avium]MDT2390506.1 hypothetical protein [Enterococcus avium]MDT2423993.1 hypothetical protein [Enterococcus avium]MDT2438310.1 hypothetical protein [Enterococcus avium]MDT2448225.1 hypothetical protein [Enterococcus avium]MDT2468419.1 hypothetical protein [Enterococcus avium]
MKFSDELFELLDSEEIEGRDDRFPGYQDQYTQGYLRGIETAANYVKRLEKTHDGAIETLKQNIKRFFCKKGGRQ